MDSVSDRRPLRDALATFASSNHTEEELRELLRRLDGRIAPTAHTMDEEEEEERNAATAEEDGDMLLAPTPVSPVAPIGPARFSAWAVQGGWGVLLRSGASTHC